MTPLRLVSAAARPRFFSASILPVLVGTAWGLRPDAATDILACTLALIATVAVHAASNAYNDVSDEWFGTDRANDAAIRPFTGGSGLIQSGALSVATMRRISLGYLTLAVIAGLLLTWHAGPAVLGFGLAGVALGIGYSWPPLRLSGRGVGEAAIALSFGALPVAGAAWLQAGSLDSDTLWTALAVSAWVAAIILANEFPDARADGLTGKRTLVVRLGPRAVALYLGLQAFGCTAAGLMTWRYAPLWTLTVPGLLFLLAIVATRHLRGPVTTLRPALQLTVAVHFAGCLWLLVLAWLCVLPHSR
jgi:1,4-dihydroxy-2-naphthoate polyprenyltransferase